VPGLRHLRGGLPGGAITGTQFSNEQVLAQFEGLLMLDFNYWPGDGRKPEPEVASAWQPRIQCAARVYSGKRDH
jgi:hypothetical protein